MEKMEKTAVKIRRQEGKEHPAERKNARRLKKTLKERETHQVNSFLW